MAAAKSVFGRPSGQRYVDNNSCVYAWRSRGITANFVTFGAGNPCTVGRLQALEVASGPWRTARGLEIGDTAAQVAALYPQARPSDGGRVIYVQNDSRYGVIPLVTAKTSGGRVASFAIFVGAAGD
jgi:hypothetical protein